MLRARRQRRCCRSRSMKTTSFPEIPTHNLLSPPKRNPTNSRRKKCAGAEVAVVAGAAAAAGTGVADGAGAAAATGVIAAAGVAAIGAVGVTGEPLAAAKSVIEARAEFSSSLLARGTIAQRKTPPERGSALKIFGSMTRRSVAAATVPPHHAAGADAAGHHDNARRGPNHHNGRGPPYHGTAAAIRAAIIARTATAGGAGRVGKARHRNGSQCCCDEILHVYSP